MSDQRPEVEGRFPGADAQSRKRWFMDHLENPAKEIADFLDGTAIDLAGARILDVGCGDGIIDLGIVRKFSPFEMIGTDITQTDTSELQRMSREYLESTLPDSLRFVECTEEFLPFPDARFDFVMSWSVFEHVKNPVRVLSEIRRVLRPRGYMFLQIWPLYFSQRGSHLWYWYPDGWEHLTRSHADLASEVAEIEKNRPDLVDATMADLMTLNQLTLGQLQHSIAEAGLTLRRAAAQSDTIDIPAQLLRYPVTDLMLSGIKLLAVRD